jgi:hypothetical protein
MNIELQLFLRNKFLELRHYLLTGLTGVVLLLVVANVILYARNVERQLEINNRQALIQQTPQLDMAYKEIVKGLAELAVNRSDPDLHDLLASQGISAKATAPSAASAKQEATDASDNVSGRRKP